MEDVMSYNSELGSDQLDYAICFVSMVMVE